MKNFHVAIVGAGVIGSSIAWELSKNNLDVVVFEKGSDVCSGTSKANSGVVHSGINSPVSSLKARFCVEGNKMIQPLSDSFGFSLKMIGKFVIAKNEDEAKVIHNIKKIGQENGVPDLEIVDENEIKTREPNISCYQALWVPTAGIISPYEFTIAFAENAAINNVNFLLNTNVKDLKKKNNNFEIKTNRGEFQSKILVNAAGLNCREIVSFLEEPDFNVYPCRGEYLVLDKEYGDLLTSMIYPVPPKELGVLGVHITPTIDENILLGPSAEFIENSEDNRTTENMMRTLLKEANEIIPIFPKKAVISAYSGIRCKLASPNEGGWADYRIEESKKTPGLINLLGIESPGLTAAPAIAKEVLRMISKSLQIKPKLSFKTRNMKNVHISEMSSNEKSDLIKKDNRWGRIVCRCENITEAEIHKALNNPLKAQTLYAVKYRSRAGMGRCQGGFCTQHIVRIMEEDFNINVNEMNLKSANSKLFYGRTREKKND
jgi:glycerol-3-phosphate dehydrogenase